MSNENVKSVTLKLTIEFEYPIDAEYSDDSIQFRMEENYCVENLIDFLHNQINAEPRKNKCTLCSCSKTELIKIHRE